MCASWSVTPCVASSSSSTTLASAIACSVLTTENFSIASNTLPLRRRPAVSISSKRLAVALERHVDRVARGAGLVEGDQPLLAEPGVDQRGLADVGPAGHGQPDRLVGVVGVGLVGRRRRSRSRSSAASTRLRMPWPCAADTGCGSPMPSSWNSASARRFAHALGLVDRQQHALAGAAQVARDVVVLRRQARRARRPRTPPHRPRPPPAASAWPSRARCRLGCRARSRRCR